MTFRYCATTCQCTIQPASEILFSIHFIVLQISYVPFVILRPLVILPTTNCLLAAIFIWTLLINCQNFTLSSNSYPLTITKIYSIHVITKPQVNQVVMETDEYNSLRCPVKVTDRSQCVGNVYIGAFRNLSRYFYSPHRIYICACKYVCVCVYLYMCFSMDENMFVCDIEKWKTLSSNYF